MTEDENFNASCFYIDVWKCFCMVVSVSWRCGKDWKEYLKDLRQSVLSKTRVGCLHWGPGCWLPGFTGTDSSPALSPDEKVVYIGSYDHYLYGGMWRPEPFDGSSTRIERYRYRSSPAVSEENVVVIGTYSHNVLAYSGDDGVSVEFHDQ